MSVVRNFVVYAFGIATALVALFGVVVFAQEADEEPADESETIDEIIVIAPRPGARRQIDKVYEDPVRAQLLKDFYKMQEDQKAYDWRKAAAEESPSKIKWGYDPSDEYQMRRQMDLQELPTERDKPATLFRFNF